MEFRNQRVSGIALSKEEENLLKNGAPWRVQHLCSHVCSHTHASICIYTLTCVSFMTWLCISNEANPPHL